MVQFDLSAFKDACESIEGNMKQLNMCLESISVIKKEMLDCESELMQTITHNLILRENAVSDQINQLRNLLNALKQISVIYDKTESNNINRLERITNLPETYTIIGEQEIRVPKLLNTICSYYNGGIE